eukprot:EG_transcript_16653
MQMHAHTLFLLLFLFFLPHCTLLRCPDHSLALIPYVRKWKGFFDNYAKDKCEQSRDNWGLLSKEEHLLIAQDMFEKIQPRPTDYVFDWGSGCGTKLRYFEEHYGGKGFGICPMNPRPVPNRRTSQPSPREWQHVLPGRWHQFDVDPKRHTILAHCTTCTTTGTALGRTSCATWSTSWSVSRSQEAASSSVATTACRRGSTTPTACSGCGSRGRALRWKSTPSGSCTPSTLCRVSTRSATASAACTGAPRTGST